jgi:D-tyrosyl-tRNA(Tyr) deacylase
MKLVVQRVKKAKVLRRAQGSSLEVVGEIEKGLFVLVGFKKGDTEKEVEVLADKLSKLRVMSDSQDKMNLSINDVGGKMLVVSQFTIYADTAGGNRPSFIDAEEPAKANKLYELFISKLRAQNIKVETGSFGDYMEIETILDGPVTILYEN